MHPQSLPYNHHIAGNMRLLFLAMKALKTTLLKKLSHYMQINAFKAKAVK